MNIHKKIFPNSSVIDRALLSSDMFSDDVQCQIAEIKEATNSEIIELKEANKIHKEANKRHEKMTTTILEVLRSQGFTTPFGSGGSSSSSYKETTTSILEFKLFIELFKDVF
jgi:hypothetical protein